MAPLNRDPKNFRCVAELINQLAKELSTSIDDVTTQFLSSALLGEFDHGSKLGYSEGEEVDLLIEHAIPSTDLMSRKKETRLIFPPVGPPEKKELVYVVGDLPQVAEPVPYHERFPVSRKTFLNWMETYELLSAQQIKNQSKSGWLSDPDPDEPEKRCSLIPAHYYDQDKLQRFLTRLFVDKHDFARWVLNTFEVRPPLLERMHADPEFSWIQKRTIILETAAARKDATSRNVPVAFLDATDSVRCWETRAEAIERLAEAYGPLADQITDSTPNRLALGDYVRSVHCPKLGKTAVNDRITPALNRARRD